MDDLTKNKKLLQWILSNIWFYTESVVLYDPKIKGNKVVIGENHSVDENNKIVCECNICRDETFSETASLSEILEHIRIEHSRDYIEIMDN